MSNATKQYAKAPPDVPHGPRLSPAQRRSLTAWASEDGWCSACGVGQTWGEPCRVVHLGKVDVADFALCEVCLSKMTAALGLK